MTIRYLDRFVSADGSLKYAFPPNGLEWSEQAAVRTASKPALGADGAHDFQGTGVSPRGSVQVSIRFQDVQTTEALVESDWNNLQRYLHQGGMGKLWMIDSDSVRRWSRARIIAMPDVPRLPGQLLHVPVVARFQREPYWYSESGALGQQASVSATQAVTITNAGNAFIRDGLVMSLTAVVKGGFERPRITNETTGEVVSSTRYARAPGAVWMIDASDLSVRADPSPGLVVGRAGSYVGNAVVGGPRFVNDYELATLGSRQSGLMSLAPGANTIIIQNEGGPDYLFDWSYFAAWE